MAEPWAGPMIFTPEERRAILAVGGLLLFGQGLGAWQSWQRGRPDDELNHWLVEWTAARVEAEAEAGVNPELDSGPAKRVTSTPSWSPPPVEVKPIEAAPPGWVDSGKIAVNDATSEQLQQLPGIGPALADRIVLSRQDAEFQKLEDLLRVPGIGERTLARLRPLLMLRSSDR